MRDNNQDVTFHHPPFGDAWKRGTSLHHPPPRLQGRCLRCRGGEVKSCRDFTNRDHTHRAVTLILAVKNAAAPPKNPKCRAWSGPMSSSSGRVLLLLLLLPDGGLRFKPSSLPSQGRIRDRSARFHSPTPTSHHRACFGRWKSPNAKLHQKTRTRATTLNPPTSVNQETPIQFHLAFCMLPLRKDCRTQCPTACPSSATS